MSNMKKCKHCWHRTTPYSVYVPTIAPIDYTCCWCGKKKTEKFRLISPMKHGKHNPDERVET
jgi:hypothetical protein